MFSVEQKQRISAAVEKVLLDMRHPEMPPENPRFHLRVDGKEAWSFAEIEPNWTYGDNNKPGVNPWNEQVAAQMDTEQPSAEQECYECAYETKPLVCRECTLDPELAENGRTNKWKRAQ